MRPTHTVHVAFADTDPHRLLSRLLEHAYGFSAPHVSHSCPQCGSADHGRPALAGRPEVSVSISRARDGSRVVAAACDSTRIGIDIEGVGAADFEHFSSIALHPREHCANSTERTRLWVRKEAILKAEGTGLARDPRTIALAPNGTVIEGTTATVYDLKAGSSWLCSLATMTSGLTEVQVHPQIP